MSFHHELTTPKRKMERAGLLAVSQAHNIIRSITDCDHEDAEVYAKINRDEDLFEYRNAMTQMEGLADA